MTNAAHHHLLHRRHPHKTASLWMKALDDLVYIGAIFGPIATLPQLLKIWGEKNASGVSLWSWVGYFFGAIIWLVYGWVHREKPIILSNFLFLILSLLIVVGIVLYG